jgi:Metallo-beta-lactamase superfamily
MTRARQHSLSRRGFCFCCVSASAFAARGGWLTPGQAFAEANGIVQLIKSEAAKAPITVHRVRGNVTILEGSGGNIAVLAGRDGKVLVDAGIAVSRPQVATALAGIGPEPVTHLINTHWHFDHANGNEWLYELGPRIVAHENTRKHLSVSQRVDDWSFDFPALSAGALPTDLFTTERTFKLNDCTLAEVLWSGSYGQRHLRPLRRVRHPAHRRHVLERHIPLHRLFDGRQHRRLHPSSRRQSDGDDRCDHHHSRTWPASQQSSAAPGVPGYARGYPRERRDAEEAGQAVGGHR